jgi:hypothetical protein
MFKRLSMNIPAVVHAILIEICRKRNISITRWVTRAIVEKFIRDGEVSVEN